MTKRPGPRWLTSDRWRRILPFAATAAAGFLIAFAAVALFLFPNEGQAPAVKVPSVVGLPFTDAERRLKALGLRAGVGVARPSADVPRTTVLTQTPPAGDEVPAGSEILLDVSEGQQQATIPVLVGLSRDDAERILTGARLTLGDVTEQPADTARGIVLAVSPVAGQLVALGTRVALVISSGPAELTMPDVVGREVEQARGMLEQLGLTLAPLDYDSASTLTRGTVVAQTPASGAAVVLGSAVTLRLAGKP